jgi:hypothetical protein
MEEPWFRKTKFSYLPITIAGYLVTVMGILFMVPVIIACLRSTHSVSDFFYSLFVYATCTAFWWSWIAGRTSKINGGVYKKK